MVDSPAAPFLLMNGYVTTHASIAGRTPRELEAALGFHPGSLGAGYDVYALAERVGLGEFEWKDRTRYADGWHLDASIGEYVQRRDELRAHLGKALGYDESKTDRRLDQFMEEQRQRLNVRAGPGRIVKLLPRSRGASYPDSELRNVPQWKLTVRKRFELL